MTVQQEMLEEALQAKLKLFQMEIWIHTKDHSELAMFNFMLIVK